MDENKLNIESNIMFFIENLEALVACFHFLFGRSTEPLSMSIRVQNPPRVLISMHKIAPGAVRAVTRFLAKAWQGLVL